MRRTAWMWFIAAGLAVAFLLVNGMAEYVQSGAGR